MPVPSQIDIAQTNREIHRSYSAIEQFNESLCSGAPALPPPTVNLADNDIRRGRTIVVVDCSNSLGVSDRCASNVGNVDKEVSFGSKKCRRYENLEVVRRLT